MAVFFTIDLIGIVPIIGVRFQTGLHIRSECGTRHNSLDPSASVESRLMQSFMRNGLTIGMQIPMCYTVPAVQGHPVLRLQKNSRQQ